MMAFNQLLAVDPGYPGATESDFVNKASNHNCILVNGGGPQPPLGEFVNAASNTAYIEDCFQVPSLAYGEVRTSYWGDSIIRCNLFPGNRYFILNDLCSAAGMREYTYQFHGNGLFGSSSSSAEGQFIPAFGNYRGTYKRDTVSLLLQVQSDVKPVVYSYETDSLATGSSSYRHYSKMLVHPDSASNISFQSVMFPYTTDSAVCTPIPGINGANATVLKYKSWTDLALTQSGSAIQTIPAAQSGLPEAAICNGQINFLSFDPANNPVCILLRGGDKIKYGSRVMLATSHPMLAAWNEVQAGIIEGYSSDSGRVSIYNSMALKAVQGNIISVTYDSSGSLNVILFSGKGKFGLEPVTGISSISAAGSVSITAFPNPSSGGIFTITLTSGKKTSAVMKITDLNFKIVHSQDILMIPGKTTVQCNLSRLPAGIYSLNLEVDRDVKRISLVKSR